MWGMENQTRTAQGHNTMRGNLKERGPGRDDQDEREVMRPRTEDYSTRRKGSEKQRSPEGDRSGKKIEKERLSEGGQVLVFREPQSK